MSLESLKLLEAKIDEFVDRHERALSEHEALQKQLQDREKQLGEALSQVKRYEKERVEVRERLQHLLQRIADLGLK